MNNKIKRLLILPSNGALYDPFVYILPLTGDFFFLQNEIYDSFLDYITTIMNRYLITKIDILDLYIQDFFYIWMYLLSFYILQSNTYYFSETCNSCDTKLNLCIDFENLIIKSFNKYNEIFPINFEYILNNTIRFTFRYRKVRNNFELGDLVFNSTLNKHFAIIIFYLLTQLEKMEIKNKNKWELISQHDYLNFLLFNVNFINLYKIFKYVRKCNKLYGINETVQYKCPKCNTVSITTLYNDISYSLYFINNKVDSESVFALTENLKHGIYLSKFNLLRFKEFMEDFPIKYNEMLSSIIDKMDFTPVI